MCKISPKNSKWLLRKWQITLGDTFFAAHCSALHRKLYWRPVKMIKINVYLPKLSQKYNQISALGTRCIYTMRQKTISHQVSQTNPCCHGNENLKILTKFSIIELLWEICSWFLHHQAGVFDGGESSGVIYTYPRPILDIHIPSTVKRQI